MATNPTIKIGQAAITAASVKVSESSERLEICVSGDVTITGTLSAPPPLTQGRTEIQGDPELMDSNSVVIYSRAQFIVGGDKKHNRQKARAAKTAVLFRAKKEGITLTRFEHRLESGQIEVRGYPA